METLPDSRVVVPEDVHQVHESLEPMRSRMSNYIMTLQDQIVSALETLDNSQAFHRDSWVRSEGGLGTSCVLSKGKVLEKAGVNISIVNGHLPPAAVKQMRVSHQEIPESAGVEGKGLPFFAAGLSLVIHPQNPMAPTVHANYRYFEITDASKKDEVPISGNAGGEKENPDEIIAWWFGGGSDLTPSYLFEEDVVHFHSTLRDACNASLPEGAPEIMDSSVFPAFKKWCDEYFYIPHRTESRGLGGIFFDDLTSLPHSRLSSAANALKPSTPDEIFQFIRKCGDAFVPSYLPILERRRDLPFTEENRRWQLIRRGRYVEFNLVYDRGTKFGLATPGARIESVLMSLPETARWEYMSDMGGSGTEEGKLVEYLKKPKDWV
ncbi:Coproporphyrinogen-III oxidase [Tulasnella sp. 330]|nr:Coproporphyrinogen-III oxidase [Tulasnella sp. 330]KAG8884603.1 Coproporphyrinogen-III oxidase [Tulasnella sp. 332]